MFPKFKKKIRDGVLHLRIHDFPNLCSLLFTILLPSPFLTKFWPEKLKYTKDKNNFPVRNFVIDADGSGIPKVHLWEMRILTTYCDINIVWSHISMSIFGRMPWLSNSEKSVANPQNGVKNYMKSFDRHKNHSIVVPFLSNFPPLFTFDFLQHPNKLRIFTFWTKKLTKNEWMLFLSNDWDTMYDLSYISNEYSSRIVDAYKKK